MLLDGIRAQQLKDRLSKIPLRTLKGTVSRIIGQGNLIAGAIKNLENRIKRIPREALQKWKDYLQKVKEGVILERMKAERLQAVMKQIPARTVKDSL